MPAADPLLASLTRAWGRAVALSASDDLPREYANVLLPLMPEMAGDLLRAHEGSRYYAEGFLMREHAPLLGRYARDLFLERIFAVHLPCSPVEIVAKAALGVAPEARGPFRERALPAIERDTDPASRVAAMLAWRKAEPDDVAARITAEALALLPSVPSTWLPRIVRMFKNELSKDDAAALLARLDTVAPEEVSAEMLLARCELSPPKLRAAVANEAVALSARKGAKDYFITALGAVRLAGFAALRPWFERYLGELRSLRDLSFLLSQVGDRFDDDLLDFAESRYRSFKEETWRHATSLAELSLHHAARRKALRAELDGLVARAIGDPVLGHRMGPGEYYRYDNMDAIRAFAAMKVSEAYEGEARRDLQRRALALVERSDTGVDHHFDWEGPFWKDFGAALDPSLRAEAARVALAIRHRPTALAALGQMVSAFPEASRHLALLGLSRLADGASPERLPRALSALDEAARLPRVAPPQRTSADLAAVAWTDRDETSLARFRAVIEKDRWFSVGDALGFAALLTPAAARRAVAIALSAQVESRRHDLIEGLSDHEALRGTVEREALIAALLVSEHRDTPLRHRINVIAERLASVCAEGDVTWAERVAAFIDGHAWDTEAFLGCVEALAPILKRLGGSECVRALSATLRDPLPTADVAQPWAHAPIGGFDA